MMQMRSSNGSSSDLFDNQGFVAPGASHVCVCMCVHAHVHVIVFLTRHAVVEMETGWLSIPASNNPRKHGWNKVVSGRVT